VQNAYRSCKEAVSTHWDLEESRVECRVQQSDSRRLQATPTNVDLWEVTFFVTIDDGRAAVLADRIHELANSEDDNSFAIEVEETLLNVVSDLNLTSSAFAFGTLSTRPSTSDADAYLNEVSSHEASVLDALLGSNNTSTLVMTAPSGVTTVAARISKAALASAEDSAASIEVAGSFAVQIPLQVFELMEAPDLVIVASDMSSSWQSVSPELLEDSLATASINLYTSDGASLEVRDLTVPIQLRFELAEMPEEGHVQCAYWDEQRAHWSASTLTQVGFENRTLTCMTPHLSIFGAIATGFLGAFECTQTALISLESLRQVASGDWPLEVTTLALWFLLALLGGVVLVAVCLDARRRSQGVWQDSFFLTATHGNPLCSEDGDDAVPWSRGTFLAKLQQMFRDAQDISSTAARDVADEVLAAIYSYFDAVRSFCEGIAGLVADAWQEGRAKKGILACFALAAKVAMQKTVRLNACAANGVHQSDVDSVMLPDGQDSSASPSRTVTTMSPFTVEDLGGGSRSTPTASCSSESDAGSVTWSQPSPGVPSKVEDNSTTAPTTLRGQNSFMARAWTLKSMRDAHQHRLEQENRKVHSVTYLTGNTLKQLLVHGPLGSVFVFSITTTSGIRALLLVCDMLGAFAVATMFMSVTGKTRGVKNPSECGAGQDAGQFIGRFVALGIASALLAKFPVLLISKLHSRRFIDVEYEGCKAWKQQLRVWQLRDCLLWCFGLCYAGLCTLYVLLFFANVLPSEHVLWLTSAGTVFAGDLVIAPFAVLSIAPLTLVISVTMISLFTWKPRRKVVEELQKETFDSFLLANFGGDNTVSLNIEDGPQDTGDCSANTKTGSPMDVQTQSSGNVLQGGDCTIKNASSPTSTITVKVLQHESGSCSHQDQLEAPLSDFVVVAI